jgi:ABC-2 type transport system ATP-binding protein
MSNEIAIDAVNLWVKYPRRHTVLKLRKKDRRVIVALQDINLTVGKGEMLIVLGRNGAGKTSLLKAMSTLVRPSCGTVRIFGYDVMKHERSVRLKVGYVVNDERSFYWRLTGRENLTFFASLYNIFGKESMRKVDELLDLMEIGDIADRPYSTYSGGQRARLSIARSMLHDPEVLLFDEITRQLDAGMRGKMLDLIGRKFIRDGEKTVVFATHNIEEARILGAEIVLLDSGRIKCGGRYSQICDEIESTIFAECRKIDKI